MKSPEPRREVLAREFKKWADDIVRRAQDAQDMMNAAQIPGQLTLLLTEGLVPKNG